MKLSKFITASSPQRVRHLADFFLLLIMLNMPAPFFSWFQHFAFAQPIAGGVEHSLKICNSGSVQVVGYNLYGQLGNGTNTSSNVPVQLSSLTGITAVAGGERHSLALKNDGTVWAWGGNLYGQLGNGTNTSSNVPVQVSSLTGITALGGGQHHSLALKNDGTVWAWGNNFSGQLGNGTNNNSNIPVQVNFLTGITDLAGGGHSLALKNDGTAWAWGYNAFGELGNGTFTNSNVPVQVSFLTGITNLAAGGGHSLALKNDGTLWAWGFNFSGQLGNGTNGSATNSNVPVQVSFLTGITDLAAGGGHSLALKNDGTVWAWGYNLSGQLGNGTNTASNVPVNVSFLTGITDLAGGYEHSLALKNNGTVWTWGRNLYGQLGSGTNTASNVPILMGGCTVTALSASISQTNVSCNGGNNGSATITASGGTLPYTYLWSTFPVQTTATAMNLSSGTYTITVTDANNNTATNTVVITQPPAISISMSVTNASSCSVSDGSIISNLSGGAAPYSYFWSNNGSTSAITGLAQGTYTLTVIDAARCIVTQTATVGPLATVSINSASSSCTSCTGVSSASTSGGTAPYTYSWNTSPVQNTATVTGLCPGIYTVTSTDANGCTAFQIVLISSGNIAAPVLVANVSCFGACNGIASVSASGGIAPYTYSWNTSPVQTSPVIGGLCAGTYFVIVTDAIGCVTPKMVIITQPASALTATAASTSASCGTCPDGTTSVNAAGGTGPYTYNWTPGGCTTPTCLGLSPGPYTVCVTDANGCTQCNTVTVNFNTGTGATELLLNNSFSVYPNPFAVQATIIFNSTINNAVLKVVDMLGKEVQSIMVNNSDKAVIMKGNLPNGIYFIFVKSENTTAVQKLIISP